ncbi:MAG: glycosyltransferase family 9 protein [Endomicrobium sp.]|jgi:ADP-heptose:LPS heptosyltransferase|nr:glycosyltransferase family 9 protein [Endomicrobium sp.]
MDKIVFFHMNQLGDLLFSLPVLKAAKQELNAKIYSVVKSSLEPLLAASNIVDETMPKDRNIVKFLKKEKINKVILFSESPISLLYVYLSGIKSRIGFNTASLSFLLTKKIERIGVPSLFNNRELGFAAGLKSIQQDYARIINISEKNIENVKKWFCDNNLDASKTIAISIGASKRRQDKCLEEYKWIEVINVLSEKGFNCVLSGAAWEKEILNNTAKKCRIAPKVFVAENGILDSAAFLKKCELFAGVDSGAMHLAAAVGTKCVAVFGYTDPSQVGPMPLKNHIVIKKEKISDITSEDIISKVLRVAI